MRRYTTEFPNLIIPGIELAGAKVFVTFAETSGKEILTVTDAEVENTEEGTRIHVQMTQARSALFQANQQYQVQVNWLDGEDRYATCIERFKVKVNLLQEVIS